MSEPNGGVAHLPHGGRAADRAAGESDRPHAVVVLSETEARYRAIIEGSYDAIVLMDEQTNVLYASRSTARIHGAPIELGRPAIELAHPDERQRLLTVLAHLPHGRVAEAEYRVRHADGSWRWVAGAATNLLTDPSVRAFVVNYREITERKHAESALWAAREELRLVTDTMTTPVTRCSRDQCYLWVNKAYAAWLQRPPEEIVGRPIAEVLGTDAYKAIHPYIERVLYGERVEYEEAVSYPGIGLRWVNATYTPTFDADGGVDGWVAVVVDVTAQKRTEISLRQVRSDLEHRMQERNALFEGAPAGIVVVSPLGDVVSANAQMEKLFGYTRDELIGRSVEMLVPSYSRAAHADFRGAYVSDPRMRAMGAGRDLTAVRKDGSEFAVEIGLSPVPTSDGLLIAAHVTDISARAAAEAALRAAHDELEHRVAERTAELRATKDRLARLSGRLLTLQDEERRRIGRELHEGTAQNLAGAAMLLAQVQGAEERLSATENKALSDSLALIDQSAHEMRTLSYLLHPPLLDETGLTSAVRWYRDGFMERTGIEIDVEIPADLGRLPGNVETALFRVMQESLTHIHRHTCSTRGQVKIVQAGESVILTIEDNGHGVPAHMAEGASAEDLEIGIAGMHERIREIGGCLAITSTNGGTLVKAIVPFD